MAMNLHQFRLRHPARRLRHVAALAHRQPESVGAEGGVGLHPARLPDADMAADDAAEREPGEMELRRRRQDDVDSGRYLDGEAVDREGQCGLIGGRSEEQNAELQALMRSKYA